MFTMFCGCRVPLTLVRVCRTQEIPFQRKLKLFQPHVLRNLSRSTAKACAKKNDDVHHSDNANLTDTSKTNYRRQFYKNPLRRALGILNDDMKLLFGTSAKERNKKDGEETIPQNDKGGIDSGPGSVWPSTCDVLVVGGGAMGSSIAYHLKERALQGLRVVVVEQDSTYKQASTVLSVGGIRQQFSVPENIQLSLFGMEFLRHAPRLLAVEGMEPPVMHFNPHGYLTLASAEGVETLRENFDVQREVGAKVEFLSAYQLKKKFPWLRTEGVEAGVLGKENEGWFDPWSLLCALRQKALHLGTEYVEGKVTGLESHIIDDLITEGIGTGCIKNLNKAEVTLPNGEKRDIKFAILVVAAGAWSGEVGRLAGIGNGEGLMATPIPVEPRKRFVYCVHAPDGPGLDCPLVIDPNGTYFRREGLGGHYLCGQSPKEDNEPSTENLDVDHEFFENEVWPTIANRVPAFENLKVRSSWGGYYDYNTFDQNGIIGIHPLFSNMFIATGFSGHGIQQAPGIGRAIMECILHGEYKSINLERFGFDRILAQEPLYEKNIV